MQNMWLSFTNLENACSYSVSNFVMLLNVLYIMVSNLRHMAHSNLHNDIPNNYHESMTASIRAFFWQCIMSIAFCDGIGDTRERDLTRLLCSIEIKRPKLSMRLINPKTMSPTLKSAKWRPNIPPSGTLILPLLKLLSDISTLPERCSTLTILQIIVPTFVPSKECFQQLLLIGFVGRRSILQPVASFQGKSKAQIYTVIWTVEVMKLPQIKWQHRNQANYVSVKSKHVPTVPLKPTNAPCKFLICLSLAHILTSIDLYRKGSYLLWQCLQQLVII